MRIYLIIEGKEGALAAEGRLLFNRRVTPPRILSHSFHFPSSCYTMTKRLRDEEFDGPSSPDSEIIETPNPPDIQKPQATSNSTPQASSKFVHLGEETGEALTVMRCSLPGHQRTLSFLSFDDYEVHYKKSHMNRCLECRKNLPSEHFLNLHIEENHDALVSVRKDRGEKIVRQSLSVCSL